MSQNCQTMWIAYWWWTFIFWCPDGLELLDDDDKIVEVNNCSPSKGQKSLEDAALEKSYNLFCLEITATDQLQFNKKT